jgi:tRNA-modifying protein YgfZ
VASTFSPDQYRALHEAAGVLIRADRGRILLRGTDRKGYLQGLLSNDILALEPGGWCYATLLTAQGRMISDMRVFDLGDLILMDLEAVVTPAVAEHLEKYIITEDVTVENATNGWGQIGVYGPQAREVLQRATSSGGAAPMYVLESVDIGIGGVEVIVPAENVRSFVERLSSAGAVLVEPSTAETTRIEAGIPRFLVDMDNTTIPLEAGIESSAISMTKGCYVGQEVIVRVLHRGGGRVAKKLVGLVIDGGPVRREDRIHAGEREVGRITSVANSPRAGKQIALGYVQRDFVEPGTRLTIRTSDAETPALVTTVPFSAA